MFYEVAQSRNLQDEWRVEAIDDANDGAVQVALFSGPIGEIRAWEYANWKNKLQEHSGFKPTLAGR